MTKEIAMSAPDSPGGTPPVPPASGGARWRVWLDVPYPENAVAKAAGARWDGRARRWYAPTGMTAALEPWAVRPSIPELLPGEDRSFGGGLFIDPVPASCWFTNARTCITRRDWDRVRRMVTARADDKCEACGAGRRPGRLLEVHERWEYRLDSTQRIGTQVLRRLICLCSDCHTSTHFGLAQLRGRANEAFAHLCTATGLSVREAAAHLNRAAATWEGRNRRAWNLDLGILIGAGIEVMAPPGAASRAGIASVEASRTPLPK